MKKKTKYVITTLALLAMSIFIFEHAVLASFAKAALKHVIALDAQMNRVIFNPIKACITIRGFKIFNPPGFKERILANVPLITMDFKAKTFFEEGAFFDSIHVHIKELNIIRTKDNVVNLAQMKALTPQKDPAKSLSFLADKYILEIEKVKYIDYTKDEKDRVKEIDLNIKEEYTNVKDPNNIAKAIAFKVFFNGQIGNIGVDIQKIQKDLAKLAAENKKLDGEFRKLAEAQIEKAKEAARNQIDTAKEAVKTKVEDVRAKVDETKKTIEEKVEDIKEKLEEKKDK